MGDSPARDIALRFCARSVWKLQQNVRLAGPATACNEETKLLAAIACVSIAVAFACALWIVADEVQHPQAMAIMNVVWPVTALYFSVFALWAYYRLGCKKTKNAMQAHTMHMERNQDLGGPTSAQVAVGTSHCGAGCMLADVVCEFSIAAAGITLLGSGLWAEYAIDFVAAWALGIVFQYFAIQPMRHLPVSQALVAAIKADTLSIVTFQIGMYAWMALVFFRLFPYPHLTPFEPQYWLMMQIAMICGYATSFPMNRCLIRAGLKEVM
jgi:hypothetical protein